MVKERCAASSCDAAILLYVSTMVKSLIKKVIKHLTSRSRKVDKTAKPAPVKEQKAHVEPQKQDEYRPSSRRHQPSTENTSSHKSDRSHHAPRHQRHQRHNDRPKPQYYEHHEKRRESTTADSHEGWTVAQYDVPVEHGKTRFYDLNLHDRLLHAISDLGFKYCTPIQAEVLPHTLLGRDAFGQAQTGTGKTAAFMLATLDYFLRNPITGNRSVGRPRALIIAPTRELVM